MRGGFDNEKDKWKAQGSTPLAKVRRIASTQLKMQQEGFDDIEPGGNPYKKLQEARTKRRIMEADRQDPLRGHNEHIRESQLREFYQISSAETPSTGPDEPPPEPNNPINLTQLWLDVLPNETWKGDEVFGMEKFRTMYRSWDYDPRNPSFWEIPEKPTHSETVFNIASKYKGNNRTWWNKFYEAEFDGLTLDNPHMHYPSEWKRLHIAPYWYHYGTFAQTKPVIDSALGMGDDSVSDKVYRKIKATRRVLVLGCATNDFCLEMYKDGYGEVVGIDWSDEAIRQQRQYHYDAKLYPGLRYECVDVITWDEPEGLNGTLVPPVESERDRFRRTMEYNIPTYENYTANVDALGQFDVIIDKGCYDQVYTLGALKTHQMLQHVSRSLKPGGTYLVYSCTEPIMETNQLNAPHAYNWTLVFSDLKIDDPQRRYGPTSNNSINLYMATKHLEDGTVVLPDGTKRSEYDFSSEDVDDEYNGYFDVNDILENPIGPDGRERYVNATEIYAKLQKKHGWRPVEEAVREATEFHKREKEHIKMKLELEEKLYQSEQLKKAGENYLKQRELEERGLDPIENETRSVSSIDTDEVKALQELQVPEEGLGNIDEDERPPQGVGQDKPIWEELEDDPEQFFDKDDNLNDKMVSELEERLAKSKVYLGEAMEQDRLRAIAQGMNYAPPPGLKQSLENDEHTDEKNGVTANGGLNAEAEEQAAFDAAADAVDAADAGIGVTKPSPNVVKEEYVANCTS